MSTTKLGLVLRISTLVGLVCLLVFVWSLSNGSNVHAAPAPQEGYPTEASPTEGPGADSGYGVETETPPVSQPPAVEGTSTISVTPPPDLFRTEDAQMNNSQTTPQVTDTPAATITPYNTPTVITTQTPTETPAPAKKKEGFTPDWGMFWIGFSLPVLAACGMVLYLLDRRPDLFKRR